MNRVIGAADNSRMVEELCEVKVSCTVLKERAIGRPVARLSPEAVAKYLSSESARMVAVSELEGLMLFLWSEHEVDGVPLEDYRNDSRPLQGLVVAARDSLGQVRDELRGFLGKAFEFVAV